MNTPRSKPRPRYDFDAAIAKAKKLRGPNGVYRAGIWDTNYAVALGTMVASWSHLEENFLYVFHSITGGMHERVTRIIFRSILSQESRIRIPREILEKSPYHYKTDVEFDEMIDEFASRTNARNKFIHGMWYTHDSGKVYIINSSEDPTLVGTHKRHVPLKEITDLLLRTQNLSNRINRRMFADLEKAAQPASPS
jgi:hypothetical protein